MKPFLTLAWLAVAVFPLGGALSTADSQPAAAPSHAPALTGEQAIAHLKDTGQYDSLGAAITAARYAVRMRTVPEPDGLQAGAPASTLADRDPNSELRTPNSEASAGAAAVAANPAHSLSSTFTPEGLRLRVRTGEGGNAGTLVSDWRLESVGYGDAQIAVPAGELRVAGQRAEIVRGGARGTGSAPGPGAAAGGAPVAHVRVNANGEWVSLNPVAPTGEGAGRDTRGRVCSPTGGASPVVTEWFVNTPAGLEHGFTLHERPAFQHSTFDPQLPLRLVLQVSGDLTPHADADGQRLDLRDAEGRTVLSYEKLKVWDATGVELPAKMETVDGQVTLAVNDATARYPLTVDPTFTQQAYLKASYSGAHNHFGYSVAMSGNTLVVGAPREDRRATGVNGDDDCNINGIPDVVDIQSGRSGDVNGNGIPDECEEVLFNDYANPCDYGAAYVFVRTGTTWAQQAYLKASNSDRNDQFGWSVAISGDTVVVGAPREASAADSVGGDQADNSAPNAGAAYVFTRMGTTWSQQAYLKASNSDADDRFGNSVAISGVTVVVAAFFEDGAADGVGGDQANNSAGDSGAAYVFVRSPEGGWSQQAYLKASNSDAGDWFGESVAISGETVVVGAPVEMGAATAVNGDQADNSAFIAGAAYVFVQSPEGAWSQQAYLKASNTGYEDWFGRSVAISGETIVVGAIGEHSAATGVNGDQANNSAEYAGAAYVFVRSPEVGWSQQAYLKASNADRGDQFGRSVAISGDTLVAGAYGEDSAADGVGGDQSDNSAFDAGAAYVFVRSGTTWAQHAYLKASNSEISDWFGDSVAISGDTLVVGAYGESSAADGVGGQQADNTAPSSGAAYVFVINPAGDIIASVQPSGPIRVGESLTVTLAIRDYIDEAEIDRVNLRVSWPEEQFTFVPGSVRINDAAGPGENWLRQPPQDGVVPGAPLPISVNVLPVAPGELQFNLRDSRAGSTRGSRAGSGFLMSFILHADSPGTGVIRPWALAFSSTFPEVTAVLVDAEGDPARVPGFTPALFTVIPANSGQIIGNVDMLGETEVAVPSRLVPVTQVTARNGPGGASGSVFLPGPYSGPFVLGGLPPSIVATPDKAYEVGVTMHFGFGRQLETFTSPWLGLGGNTEPPALVPAAGTLDLGNIFVMAPGYVEGGILLRGPDESLLGRVSPLRGLVRAVDRDFDLDGLPDFDPDGDSRVSASGRHLKAPGATYSAAGATAFASFEGEYWDAADGFEGSYRLALAGLNREPSIWQNLGMNLVLHHGDPAQPETYVHQKLLLAEKRYPDGTLGGMVIQPGEHYPLDLNYCFSEVTLDVAVESGTLWAPRVQVFNSGLNPNGPPATDFQGNPRQYLVELDRTEGTPRSEGEGAPRGRVVMLLPEGDYQFQVTMNSKTPGGEDAERTLNNILLKVGCGERIRFSPDFKVEILTTPPCGSAGLARVDGRILSPTGGARPVTRRLEWTTATGAMGVFCDGDCPADGVFSLLLPTGGPCEETVFTITATAEDGRVASITRTIPRDTTPPVFSGVEDKTAICGAPWTFDRPTATDACDGEVAVEELVPVRIAAPCGYIMEQRWRATDRCGNRSEFTQRVTVQDTMGPAVQATDGSFRCSQDVFYSVFVLDCSEVSITYDPPFSGPFLPGTIPVHFTVTDACGNRTTGSFKITVREFCEAEHTSGMRYSAIGAPRIEPLDDGALRLLGLDSEELRGVRLVSGPVPGLRVDFDAAIASTNTPEGGEFRVDALGAQGTALASVRMSRFLAGGIFQMTPAFNAAGATRFNLRLHHRDTLVFESLGRAIRPPDEWPFSSQILSAMQPRAVRAALRPDQGLVFELFLDPFNQMSIISEDGSILNTLGDRLEIWADAGGAPGPASITGLELRFSGLPRRILSGVALERFDQEVRGGSGAVLHADGQGILAELADPQPTGAPSATAAPAAGWDRLNPPGWYGNWDLGNPARFTGAGLTHAPLVQVDLTDVPAATLLRRGYRAGKSVVALTAIPTIPDKAHLQWNVGGVLESTPGAPSVTLGALTFLREGDRTVIWADPHPSPSGLPTLSLEVRLSDGQSRRYEGTREELRVPASLPATGRTHLWTAAINAAGHLLLGIAVPEGEPAWSVGTPDGQTVSAVALTWELPLVTSLAPGSLRGVEIAGAGAASVRVVDLTTSTVNPTEATYFGGRRVQALGHGAFAHDRFGNLELRGLSPSGHDGVAIEYAPGGPLRLELGNVTGSAFRYSPSPAGAVLNFRLVDKANAAQPFAVLHGAEPCGGGQFGYGARFPGLKATTFDLRLSLAGQAVLTRPDRPVTSEGGCGPVIVENPSSVSVEVIEGRFAWVLHWNRTVLATLAQEGGPYRVDRVELIADAPLAQPYPNTLEFRASHYGNWRLPAIVDRALPAVSELAFKFDAGGLLLDWDKVATGLPRLETAPEITGPWQAVGLGQALGSGRREARIATSGVKSFIRLGGPGARDGCLDLDAEAPGARLNPWEVGGWKIERYDRTGALHTENTIITVDLGLPGETSGLLTDDRVEVELPLMADEVWVTFRSLGNAATFVALDGEGREVRRKVYDLTTGGLADLPKIFNLGGPLISRLRIEGSGQPVLLMQLCVHPSGSRSPMDTPACLSWRGDQPGPVDNPWRQPGVTVTSVDASGEVIPRTRTHISPYEGSGLVGYEVEHQTTLEFDEACPWVTIEFVSASGDITFEAYPVDGGEPQVERLVRVTDVGGETVEFRSEARPIKRVVITTPGNLTRILTVCCGPIPRLFCREVATIDPPLRNPQPVGGDTRWTFYNPDGGLGTSALRTVGGETGLELSRETDIEFFAADQRRVELRIVVEEPGATLSAVATTVGGGGFAELPETAYPAGVHTLVLDDPCAPGDCGATLHRVRLKLLLGSAIVTRVCTPFGEH